MSMKLSEIAAMVSECTGKYVSVGDISAQTIIDAREAKKISRSEADRLLSELKEADGIWENPVKPDAKTAECLWEQ